VSLDRKRVEVSVKEPSDDPVVSLVEESAHSSEEEKEQLRRQTLKSVIEKCYIKHGIIPTTTPEFYRYGKLLGKGAFGKVILGIHALSGRQVAIKYIEKAYMKEERRKRKVFQEILAMRTVSHPNVIRLYEVFESNNHLLMVMEYARGGDLLHFVKERGRLCEDEARGLFRQVVEAVRACHARNIIHRDVKLDNVLLDEHGVKAILCDFGVCRTLRKGELIREHCGTPAYLAPEIIANMEYDGFYVDFWSLGVMLYAMVSGTLPFRAKTLPDLQKSILRGRYELPDFLSEDVCDVIFGLLQLVPQNRLSFDQLFQHPWVSKNAYSIPPSPALKREEQDNCLRKMKHMGFYPNCVLQSLKMREMNHATATFYLLLHQPN
jgi:serine/threonine protein kinase